MKIKAPAKINLTLEIVKRLSNGYHELRTVILKLDGLFDEITVEFVPNSTEIKIQSDSKEIPLDEKNTCYRVAQKYFEKVSKSVGLEIRIKKNIPIGAGFGGGSSDGAAVLLAINKYFKNKLSQGELVKIASEVGKDIPVFLPKEKVVMVTGMGEKLQPIQKTSKLSFLTVNPGVHSSTQKAFESVSRKLWFMENRKRTDISRKMTKALKNKDKKEIAWNLYNDFEVVLEKTFPVIKELKQALLAFGAEGVLMTGAGSSVFGIFSSKKEALIAKKILAKRHPNFFFHAE